MRACQRNRHPEVVFLLLFFQCALASLLPILRHWRFLVKVSQREPETQNLATRNRQEQDLWCSVTNLPICFLLRLSKITWVGSSNAASLCPCAFEPLNQPSWILTDWLNMDPELSTPPPHGLMLYYCVAHVKTHAEKCSLLSLHVPINLSTTFLPKPCCGL